MLQRYILMHCLVLDFTRTEDCAINAALNYGYSVLFYLHLQGKLLQDGYITQLGLLHDNMFNQFNFASDLMEPFRILVDREVVGMAVTEFDSGRKDAPCKCFKSGSCNRRKKTVCK